MSLPKILELILTAGLVFLLLLGMASVLPRFFSDEALAEQFDSFEFCLIRKI